MSKPILQCPVGDWDKADGGKGSFNRKKDVLTVQYMLLKISLFELVKGIGYKNKPKGIIDKDGDKSSTVKAIRKFQKKMGVTPVDGVVRPTGATLNHLVSESGYHDDQKQKTFVVAALGEYRMSMGFEDCITAPYAVSPTTINHDLIPKIKDGTIRVMLIPDNTDAKDAVYYGKSNILAMETSSAKSKALAIHEAIHGLQDVLLRKIPRPWNEVAPYVAQHFFRYKKYKNATFNGKVAKAALQVIESWKGKKIADRKLKQSDKDVQNLHDVLKAGNYKNKKGTFTGDG